MSSPEHHLDLWLKRVRLLLERYMRRYADRLVKADGSYSDDRVGVAELRRILESDRDGLTDGHALLDELGVRRLDTIDDELAALDGQLASTARALENAGETCPSRSCARPAA